MSAPMQCQVEAGRFASSADAVDEIRHTTVAAARRLLGTGNFDRVLQIMFDGLALQAPLSFKRPTVGGA